MCCRGFHTPTHTPALERPRCIDAVPSFSINTFNNGCQSFNLFFLSRQIRVQPVPKPLSSRPEMPSCTPLSGILARFVGCGGGEHTVRNPKSFPSKLAVCNVIPLNFFRPLIEWHRKAAPQSLSQSWRWRTCSRQRRAEQRLAAQCSRPKVRVIHLLLPPRISATACPI
jgi:hypothetical protein